MDGLEFSGALHRQYAALDRKVPTSVMAGSCSVSLKEAAEAGSLRPIQRTSRKLRRAFLRRGRSGRKEEAAVHDRLNRRKDFLRANFVDVAASAGCKGSFKCVLVRTAGKNDDTHIRQVARDFSRSVDAVELWHLKVHYNDMRALAICESNRFAAIVSFADYHNFGMRREHEANHRAHAVIVVADENPNRCWCRGHVAFFSRGNTRRKRNSPLKQPANYQHNACNQREEENRSNK